VREQLAAERPQQRQQRPGQVAAADEADRLAGQQERAAVDAVVEHRLGARANLGVAAGNVARGSERHPECELCDRLAEDRADAQHLDPAGEAGGVVDVRQEVALDVEHRPELGRPRKPVGRERGLADDGRQVGQERLHELRAGGRAVVPGDGGEGLEPRTCFRREDLVERPRVGVDEEHPREPTSWRQSRARRCADRETGGALSSCAKVP